MLVQIFERFGSGMGIHGRKPGSICDVPPGTAETWISKRFAVAVSADAMAVAQPVADKPESLVPQRADVERMVPQTAGQRLRKGRPATA